MNYFAYGSNLLTRRLRERVGEVRVCGAGRLSRHQLRFHKISEDGSGKCDIHASGSPKHVVHGVVFEIEAEQKSALDHFEGLGLGYEEVAVRVSLESGGVVTAFAYRALVRDERLRPYRWYHALVAAGAREHRLPPPYLEEIERVAWIEDPDEERTRRHLALIRDLAAER